MARELGLGEVPSYGSFPSEAGGSQPARVRRSQVTWLAGAAVCAAVVGLTLIAVSWPGDERSALLQKSPHTTALDEAEAVLPPTAEELASFKEGAEAVLTHVGIDPADIPKTDLHEACGDFMEPCIASVGSCLMSYTPKVGDREEPTKAACQCYVDGKTKPILVPDRTDAEVHCSFTCLSAIKGMFQHHLFQVNGDAGSSLACPRTFENLAHEVYANEFMYDVKPSEEDTDGLQMESVVDEKVLAAAEAVQLHINLIRSEECPAIAQATGDPHVTYARRGDVEAGLGQFLLEFTTADGQEFTSRVVHLPEYKRVIDPATAAHDPENLLGSFEVFKLSPDPCASGAAAVLAQTRSRVLAINAQKLSWKAAYDPIHEGKTMDQYGMGLQWPSEQEIQANTVVLADDHTEVPDSFDARDVRDGETPCKAFDVMNQGGCGSCYAFAAATALSARFCKDSQRKWDIVLSPQEMMDCTRGCSGGWPLTIYKKISTGNGYAVENWCDPYKTKKQVCGDTCEEGQHFRGLAGTAVIVSGKGATGVKNMQRQLLKDGPGVVAVTLHKDFHAYKSGVYSKTAGSPKLGGHAVTLIGWGTEDGVDYWLVQNSWGARAGDEGFWKIRRGTNECGIENTGLMVVKPEIMLDCTEAGCQNGGSPNKQCQCQCPAPWTGDHCEVCSRQCFNGGKVISSSLGMNFAAKMVCKQCFCPEGTTGEDCGTKLTISPAMGTDDTEFTLEGVFAGATRPTSGSFVALYSEEASGSMTYIEGTNVYLCGDKYDASVNGGLCPDEVKVTLVNPGRDGKMIKTYKIMLVQYNPPNEFGLEGYPQAISADDELGELQVAKKMGGKSGVQVLARVRSARQNVQQQIIKAEEAQQLSQEEMDARLDEVQRLLKHEMEHGGPYGEFFPPAGTGKDALPTETPEPEKAEGEDADPQLPGSLTVSGSMGEHAIMWTSGAPTELCWRLPEDYNYNPKFLFIYVGDGSDLMYYPTGLLGGGKGNMLPASQEACKSFSVSPGIPAGAIYTLKLQHESEVLAAEPLLLAHAAVAFESYALADDDQGHPLMTLPVKWSVTPEAASVKDTVKVVDAQGDVVDWFFTSCSCKGPVGEEPVPEGQAEFKISAPTDKTPGAYELHFHPDGGEFVGAVADEWIPWTAAWNPK